MTVVKATYGPPIKYRVWDPDAHRMIGWEELLATPNLLILLLRDEITSFIPMPFLGLFDTRSNAEIYAGDIVRQGDNYPSVIEWNQKDEMGEGTGWVLHEYYPRSGPNADEYDRHHTTSGYTDGLELIGNVFEQAELVARHYPVCPECFGQTIIFRGKGLESQYKLCSKWKQPGHLTEAAIKEKYEQMGRIICPSGRFA